MNHGMNKGNIYENNIYENINEQTKTDVSERVYAH